MKKSLILALLPLLMIGCVTEKGATIKDIENTMPNMLEIEIIAADLAKDGYVDIVDRAGNTLTRAKRTIKGEEELPVYEVTNEDGSIAYTITASESAKTSRYYDILFLNSENKRGKIELHEYSSMRFKDIMFFGLNFKIEEGYYRKGYDDGISEEIFYMNDIPVLAKTYKKFIINSEYFENNKATATALILVYQVIEDAGNLESLLATKYKNN
ncbi:MAG: hypothetical protein JXR63_12200 [Spirochaetales bacterium]|nr:hypothetical protein [Spirochaetales bacterium]